jgi:hypothetical protein
MNRRTRLRRTGILCMHFVRNAAYYRAFNAAPVVRRREQFWRTLNGNFIDICMLEWCKLFGDLNAQHHWSKCVTDANAFSAGLYDHTGLNELEFEAYRIEVRKYRDKFVAHLDELTQMQIPQVQPALDSVRYLYQYLLEHEDDVNAFYDAPRSANARYQQHLHEGRGEHAA